MDSYDVIANQPVVIDNVSVGIHCFVTVTGPFPVDRAPQRHTVLRAHGHTPNPIDYSGIHIKNRILGGSYGVTDSLFTWKVLTILT